VPIVSMRFKSGFMSSFFAGLMPTKAGPLSRLFFFVYSKGVMSSEGPGHHSNSGEALKLPCVLKFPCQKILWCFHACPIPEHTKRMRWQARQLTHTVSALRSA